MGEAQVGTAEEPREVLLAGEGLHTHYGASHILHGVDLALHRGECLALLGRNGMGKTTTLRTLMGHIRPTAGQVFAFGTGVTGRSAFQIARRGIAFVPEGRGIFPNLTVRENLIMAARPGAQGRRDWTFERILDSFPRLGERLDHWGNQLSGGEQQMLTLGRALLTNPDILLIDEATEGLAPLIRAEIWDMVRSIKAAGIACIIVDKNIKQLVEIADRHMILVRGRVVFEGDSEALLRDPDMLHRHLGV